MFQGIDWVNFTVEIPKGQSYFNSCWSVCHLFCDSVCLSLASFDLTVAQTTLHLLHGQSEWRCSVYNSIVPFSSEIIRLHPHSVVAHVNTNSFCVMDNIKDCVVYSGTAFVRVLRNTLCDRSDLSTNHLRFLTLYNFPHINLLLLLLLSIQKVLFRGSCVADAGKIILLVHLVFKSTVSIIVFPAVLWLFVLLSIDRMKTLWRKTKL